MTLAQLIALPWLPAEERQTLELLAAMPEGDRREAMRKLLRRDLWALLVLGLARVDLAHPWLYARCLEVQGAPDGFLDLWARGHYKSTIITFAKTIQDILGSHGDDPLPHFAGVELTFGIFSHTRPIAKAFLRQIKLELERNDLLQELYPDVLYAKPMRDAPRWSEDAGLVVKRRTNPKEGTVEAWGLVDGQPVGKHFNVLIYDDVVVPGSVTNPDMIQKTTEAFELSLNLGDEHPRKRGIGTRYHFGDTYRSILHRGTLTERLRAGSEDGTLTGKPVLLSREAWETKVRDMGPYIASAQLLLNPIADSAHRFLREWLERRFDRERITHQNMQRALLVDPSSGKKGSDFTSLAVVGLGPDLNVYLLDFIRDRLNLTQRASEVIRLHKRWRPHRVGYEEYGMQADIEYLKIAQAEATYHFEIEPLKGKLAKFDRINRLVPVVSQGKFYLPDAIMRTTYEGKLENQIEVLIEQEFLAWPVPAHDDGLDAIARYLDLDGFAFPAAIPEEHPDDRYNRGRRSRGSWMSR